jgi:hypothetical protein
MPKILTDAVYTALKQKADNYDAVVTAVVGNGEGVTADNVTPDVIAEALNATGENVNTEELQTQLTAATQRAEAAEQRAQELEIENANLINSAGEDTAGIDAKGGEPGAAPESIAAFADTNAGNTAAILTEMQNQGII